MVSFIFRCTNPACKNCGLEVRSNVNDPSPCLLCKQPLQFIKTETTQIKQNIASGVVGGVIIGGILGGVGGAVIGGIIGSAIGKSISEKERRKREFGDRL